MKAYCMFLDSRALVASVWGHILHVYLRAWYMTDGISLELVKTEPALRFDGVCLQQMNSRPGFVMKIARSIEQMIVARFAADATR